MWPLTDSYPELSAADVDGKTFDYIIVGGGTSGCVLAHRLSEDPSVSVLVLEKGAVNDNFLSRNPLMSQNFRFPFLQSVQRLSEPIPQFRGRRAQLWTAEAVGGASRINGQLLTRGVPGGYNQWAADFGLSEWSWDKVEPYFRKSENCVGHPLAKHRGHEGRIENRPPMSVLPCIPFVDKAAQAVGCPFIGDGNDPTASAQGCVQLCQTIDSKGWRLSSYRAWLNGRIANERRAHLSVCTRVVASKLLVDQGSSQVKGVQIRPVAGAVGKMREWYTVQARREVIVCSGTICTPQLLMLSGIGPRDQIEPLGISVVKELPAVGKNLSDHTSVPVMMELPRNHTLHFLENALTALWLFVVYLFTGKGPFAETSTPRSVFVRSGAVDDQTMSVKTRDEAGNDTMDASLPRNIPDIEIMIIPINTFNEPVPGKSLFSWYATSVQPFSRGRVELVSTDPQVHPRVHYPMLTDERDFVPMRKATRFAMRLAEEFSKTEYPHPSPMTFSPGIDLEYLDSVISVKNRDWRDWNKQPDVGDEKIVPIPGSSRFAGEKSKPEQDAITKKLQKQVEKINWRTVSDEEIDEYAKRVCISALHFSSTCRMALDDKTGVVDQRLKVHGFQNLRIADASVFPLIPSAHTMAPTIMVAERCADFIKRDWAERKQK
ncbi:hypothetical protein B0H66DRAFT_498729 [Apodospora peruviana]|uniref:Glucose-methanol-choline oxidoreductase N-terminal domain-containing protein n=1 Tax=Apodospora peruviana TaxID=516989 RepID=A0AAE0I181_9PEZI|nr:hypothetical protein B0H66DRAFT_498729 [Apodospora peruviana]